VHSSFLHRLILSGKQKFHAKAAGSLRKQKRRVVESRAPGDCRGSIFVVMRTTGSHSLSGVDMSTSLHSEKSLLLQTKRSVAQVQALAAHQLPVALTLSAIILSVLGVKP
jgi:hypothetical protein